MSHETEPIVSDEEKEILQEIMNIAFGNATADLAEVIDIYVVLSVPNIEILGVGAIPNFIEKSVKVYSEIDVVEQKFWGDFNGSGLLVFPNNAGRELINVLDEGGDVDSFEAKPIDNLEKDILMEIGNILIGACVGKVAELLGTIVTYSPPQVISNDNNNEYSYFIDSFDPNQSAILMKTVFKFKDQDISGLLLLLTNQESIEWLKQALNAFMESYE
ncbi:MAG: chemotaxis protein CheC [Desulfobacterales bacterium]|nr:chemotaxis protein CheC [Desulfobacterales bacterium]